MRIGLMASISVRREATLERILSTVARADAARRTRSRGHLCRRRRREADPYGHRRTAAPGFRTIALVHVNIVSRLWYDRSRTIRPRRGEVRGPAGRVVHLSGRAFPRSFRAGWPDRGRIGFRPALPPLPSTAQASRGPPPGRRCPTRAGPNLPRFTDRPSGRRSA